MAPDFNTLKGLEDNVFPYIRLNNTMCVVCVSFFFDYLKGCLHLLKVFKNN